ncbi:MAG: hypothetical protein K2Y37_08475 [Pirellulales bacterium]|nr:hypothetical protein [Pirellulales bacterium]
MGEEVTGMMAGVFGVVLVAYVSYKVKRKRQHLNRIAGILRNHEMALVVSLEALVDGGELAVAASTA